MTPTLQPYPAYKPSGARWLGDVPDGWEVSRLKYSIRETDARSASGMEQLLRVSQYTGVTERRRSDGLDEADTRAASLIGYKRVHPNQLVVNIMLAWNGSMGVSRFEGIASPAYCVYRFGAGVMPWYFDYLLRSPTYKGRIKAVSTGVVDSRLRLYTDDLYRLQVPLPPLDEQRAIVRFLDHADRRIRRAVAAKRKLIALLNEEKQAIIHRAVTRGLDPNVPFKPSGVEWLGDIPAHWEVRPAKFLFREIDHRSERGLEVLLSLRMYRGVVPHNDVSQVPIGHEALVGFKKVAPGQLVMNRMRAAIGMFGLATQPGLVSPDYAVFQPAAGADPTYFLRVFKTSSARTIFRIESKGLGTGSSGFMRLYTDRFGRIHLPLPSFVEQGQIVRAIEDLTKEIECGEARIQHQIDLLLEYRTRLIADVVTGKLDVREAAATLPDETDEPELLDDVDTLSEDGEPGDDRDMEGDSEEDTA